MNCPQCLSQFNHAEKIPRILPSCGHSVCQDCISTLYQDPGIYCPQCAIFNNATSPNSFPLNLALMQIQSQRNTEDMCDKHGKQIEAYCNTDRIVLCINCILDDGHKTHDIGSVQSAAAKQRESLANVSSMAEQTADQLDESKQEILKMMQNQEVSYNKVSQEYVELYDLLKQGLDSRLNELLENIKHAYLSEVESIANKQSYIETNISKIQALREEIQNIENESDLLLLKKSIERENLIKQANIKIPQATNSKPFQSFTKDTEANFIWKLIRDTFATGPKTARITVKKQPEDVPLALANQQFSRELRNPAKQPERAKTARGKPKVTTQPTSQRPAKKPVKRQVGQNDTSIRKFPSTDLPIQDYSQFSAMDEDSYMVRSIDLASLCRPSNCYIYVAGGFSDRGINSVERYNCEIDSWDQMAQSLSSRTQAASVILHDKMLLMGGKDMGKRVSTIEEYDRDLDQWKISKFQLKTARSGFGAVSIANDLYIIGGNDGTASRNMEIYSNGQWAQLQPMINRRDEVSAVLGPDLNIYAVGGYGGPDVTCLKSVEKFDITTNQWSEIPNMSIPRRALTVVTLPDGIYSIGGYDGSKYLNSVEKLDIRMNSWIKLQGMKYNRCTLSAVVTQDCQYIYAIGGFNGNALDVVERYSVVEDTWTEVGRLQCPRFMHCSVLFSD